jgi:uncharacterized membrane protein (DUF441 family)
MSTELVAIILSVGGLLPLLTSVVEQPQWSARTRTVMSVIVSIIAGIVTYVSAEGLHFESPSAIVATVVGVIITSAASYKTLWKPTGATQAIEDATSPSTAA